MPKQKFQPSAPGILCATWPTICKNELLTNLEMSMPDSHPFQHRSQVNKRSLGAGFQELTAIVNDEMISTCETTILAKDQQSLWGRNCLKSQEKIGHNYWQW